MTTHVLRRRATLTGAMVLLALIAGVPPLAAPPVAAQQRDCLRPLRDAITILDVPGIEPTPTRDGCWLFTAIMTPDRSHDGVAALRRTDTGFELHRSVPLVFPNLGGIAAFGLALTQDETILVVSHFQKVTFLDVGRMTTGSGDPVLGVLESRRLSRSWGVKVSSDDKYALAAQQGTSSVVMIDLDKIRKGVFDESALAGYIPTAQGPTNLLLSSDGRHLYTTTLQPPDVVDAPLTCAGGTKPEGSIQITDMSRARTDPASATIGFAFPATCGTTYVSVSPDGNRLAAVGTGELRGGTLQGSVPLPFTSVDSGMVSIFDARPVRDGKPPVFVAKVPVSTIPVRVFDSGDRLIVGFASQPPMVIDASRLTEGKAAILGTLPFPSAFIKLSRDARTLFAATGGGAKLAVVDLQRVQLIPLPN